MTGGSALAARDPRILFGEEIGTTIGHRGLSAVVGASETATALVLAEPVKILTVCTHSLIMGSRMPL